MPLCKSFVIWLAAPFPPILKPLSSPLLTPSAKPPATCKESSVALLLSAPPAPPFTVLSIKSACVSPFSKLIDAEIGIFILVPSSLVETASPMPAAISASARLASLVRE